MDRRLELHEKLCSVLGSRNVYFQPPESVKLSYPCILYELSKIATWYANDKIYSHRDRYSVTVVDRNPDSKIPNDILESFSLCSHDRNYTADNLNHFVFTIYY